MRTIILTIILIVFQISSSGQVVDYIDVLNEYPTYDTIKYGIPDFTYQSNESIKIQNFRHKYKLDSIAGKGDEFDKQIKLLKWVNCSLRHNGNSPLSSKINIDTLAIIGQKEGLNCGGLAIILNAVYLSMGYKSRFITCLNSDSTFNDPHSLTIVFSNHYNKWIMVDPTYCAFFIDEQNVPFSIEEIRQRLMDRLKIQLNEDFNLNSISTSANKPCDYYQYITRNMFRFISPLHSKFEYDLDCLEYVHLIPKGYRLNGMPLGQEVIEGCSKVYCIDDQKQFWR
jgi:hypothetical protein